MIYNFISEVRNGGAEKVVLKLHGAMRSAKHCDTRLIVLKGDGNVENGLVSLGASRFYSINSFLIFLSFVTKELKRGDVLHTHLTPCQLYTFLLYPLLKLKRIKLVTTVHSLNTRRDNTFFGRMFNKYLYRSFDKVLCVSSTVQIYLISRYSLKNTIVVINGVEKRFEKISKPKDSIKFLSLSRLHKVKQIDKVISYFGRINNSTSVLNIVGTGPEEKKLKDLVTNSNLKSIVFHGFSNNVDEHYSKNSVFIALSLHEGFGLSVLEAMSFGMPIIMSNIEIFKSLYSDYPKELFIDDFEGFKNAVSFIQDNFEDIQRCCLEYANKYSFENQMNLLMKIYKEE
ncbi:glycosyltransferase [Halobacteriovorax sp. DA5]|uniref:glycosyltransferase n=1 Tax=Halobacteriovorax sp. DA5 TaxID=2067553 RepID=UPI000CD290FE|nr:glycosyltransferase [Halobacteriovorax sp. DA5]POB13198.1 hypothetical protein C0Z22_11840 [Halobacteriovorax sp. DA5]